ncbi:tRNA (adenosine(37)-N6)-threonylcarbamoyltransferase complex ATPase subunit type 1 TsaE [Methylosoma difficile]
MEVFLADTEATERFGAQLWQHLPDTCVIFLNGDLGAGKTTLVRGCLRAAGFTGAIKSPTYTLVEEYSLGDRKLYHFDLYRLADPEELEWIGIRDYFAKGSLAFIEWPEKGQGFLPPADKTITLLPAKQGRLLTINDCPAPAKNL